MALVYWLDCEIQGKKCEFLTFLNFSYNSMAFSFKDISWGVAKW